MILKRIIIVGLLLVCMLPIKALAINEVNVYFFHSDECSICNQEKAYLQALKKRYPNMRIYSYEIGKDSNNELMEKAKKLYKENQLGVPFTVIGDTPYLGFSQGKKAQFQKSVYDYSKAIYNNELGKILNIGYRNDLEGTVQEYRSNDQYKIEETSNVTTTTNNEIKDGGYNKYKASFFLVAAGVVLAFVAYLLHVYEKRSII